MSERSNELLSFSGCKSLLRGEGGGGKRCFFPAFFFLHHFPVFPLFRFHARALPVKRKKRKKKKSFLLLRSLTDAFPLPFGCSFFPRHSFSPARQCKERVMGLGGERGGKIPFLLVFFGCHDMGKRQTCVKFSAPSKASLSPSFLSHILTTGEEPIFLKKKSGKFINWETERMTLAPRLQGPVFWGRERIPCQESIFFCTYFLSPKGR